MEQKIEYKLIKKEPILKEAKITEYKNNILNKNNLMPSFMVNVQSGEDLEAIKLALLNENFSLDRLSGIVIPFDRLDRYYKVLKNIIPKNLNLISEVKTEAFYSTNLKEKIKNYYYQEFKSLPEKLKNLFKQVIFLQSWAEKQKKHTEVWASITQDKTLLNSLITSFINKQSASGINILSSITPILVNAGDIDNLENSFLQHQKLYHSEIYNIEEMGKVIGLNLVINPSFLKKDTLVNQLFLTIHRLKPKAIIYKLDVTDIRKEDKKIIDNYIKLAKGLSNYSDLNNAPIINLNSNSEGLILLSRGVDCFVQPLSSNFLERNIILGKLAQKRLSLENPNYLFGRIYDYNTKEFLIRDSFLKDRFTEEGIPKVPLDKLKLKKETLGGLSQRQFRIFAKLVLMESRNMEVNEIHKAIEDGTIRQLKSKFIYWDNKQKLFPK